MHRVLIADSDPLVLGAMRRAFATVDDVVLVAHARNTEELVEQVQRHQPRVVLMDLALPGQAWVVVLREIASCAPGARVVVMSVDQDDALALYALQVGACGYVTKHVELGALPRIVRGAAVGEAVLSRRLTMRLVQRFREVPHAALGTRPVRSPLTTREWEVLDALCGGASTRAIANTLRLSNETVRSHVKSILRKLKVHTREQAIELAPRLRHPTSPPVPDLVTKIPSRSG